MVSLAVAVRELAHKWNRRSTSAAHSRAASQQHVHPAEEAAQASCFRDDRGPARARRPGGDLRGRRRVSRTAPGTGEQPADGAQHAAERRRERRRTLGRACAGIYEPIPPATRVRPDSGAASVSCYSSFSFAIGCTISTPFRVCSRDSNVSD